MANKKSIRYTIVFVLILLLGSTGIFLTKTDAGFTIVYGIVQKQIDRQYGLNLSIEKISTKMRSNLQADKIEFANADSSVILKVDTLNINYSGIFELFGRRHLDSLILISPDIFINISEKKQFEGDVKEIEFPQFLISNIKIERAKLHIQSPDTLISQDIDRLECYYSGKKDGAHLKIKQLMLNNESLGIKIADLSSEITIKRDIAKLRNLKFKLNDSKVTSQGKIRYVAPLRFKFSFGLEDFRIEEYLELPLVHIEDKMNFKVDVLGDFKEFTAMVDVDGSLNKRAIVSNINLEYKDDHVHVLDAEFKNEANDLSFYGTYGLKDQYLSATLIPHTFLPSDWVENIPDCKLEGYLKADGYLDSKINLNYNIDCLELYDLSKATFAGNIEFDGLDNISIDSSNRIILPEGMLKVNGSVKDLEEFDLNINGNIAHLAGLDIPNLSEFDLDNMCLTLKADGKIKDPNIQMNFNLDTLNYANLNLKELNVSVFSKNTITEPGGALLITMEDVSIDSIELGDIQTYVHMQEKEIDLDYLDIIHQDYNLSLSGAINDYKEFKINKLQGVYQGEDVYLLEPVTFNISENTYTLSRFDILYRDALLFGSFNMSEDSLEGSLNIAGAELNSVPLISTIVDSVEGILDMNIDITGSLNDPNIDMEFQLKRAFVFGLGAKKVRSELHYSDSLVQIHNLSLQIDDQREMNFSGKFPLSINFTSEKYVDLLPDDSLYVDLDLDQVRLEKLLPFILPQIRIVGEIDAGGKIRGTINDPIMDAKLAIHKPEIALIVADSILADYHYSHERIFFNNVDVIANNGFYEGNANFYMDLRLQTEMDRYQADSSIYVYVQGTDDEMLYLTPFIAPMESLTGEIYSELEMTGNFNKTIKNGKIKIDKGDLAIDILGNEIKNISGEGIIENNIAKVNLRGLLQSDSYSLADIFGVKETNSNFVVNGNLDMRYLLSPSFDLKLKGDQLSIKTLDESVNLTTGVVDLAIAGKDTLTITGDVTIQEGAIEYSFNRSAPTASAPPSNFEGMKTAYSLNAIVDKVYFRNQLLDVTLNGEMLLQKFPNELSTRMGGELEVTEGFFNYWASVFVLEQGSSLILDQFENNHQINFTATKEIEGNTIIASITGELNNPEINFTDENSEMSQAQIVRTLTVGEIQDVLTDVGLGGNSDGSGKVSIDFKTATNALLTLAEVPIEQQARQIGHKGGLDRIDIKSGTNGSYIDETTALVIGGRIGRNFYLTYEASQEDPWNMEFEYRLNNRVSIIGAADEKKVEGAVRLRLQY